MTACGDLVVGPHSPLTMSSVQSRVQDLEVLVHDLAAPLERHAHGVELALVPARRHAHEQAARSRAGPCSTSCFASTTGLRSGSTRMPVPSLMLLVRAAIAGEHGERIR